MNILRTVFLRAGCSLGSKIIINLTSSEPQIFFRSSFSQGLENPLNELEWNEGERENYFWYRSEIERSNNNGDNDNSIKTKTTAATTTELETPTNEYNNNSDSNK